MRSPWGDESVVDVEARVRQNAGSAALTAGLLIFFGFFWFGEPAQSGVFLVGDTLFHFALRGGGMVMVAIAVWSCIGDPRALLIDAAASLLIGVSLMVSAVLLTIGGGFTINYLIYLVCGVSFISSALSDWRDYRRLPVDDDATVVEDSDEAGESVLDLGLEEDTPLAQRWSAPSSDSSIGSTGGREASSAADEPIVFDRTKPPRPKRPALGLGSADEQVIRLDDLPPASATPPSEGYLAGLARKGQPPPK